MVPGIAPYGEFLHNASLRDLRREVEPNDGVLGYASCAEVSRLKATEAQPGGKALRAGYNCRADPPELLVARDESIMPGVLKG